MTDAAPIEHQAWLTGGDFTEDDEPFRLFAAWFAEAKKSEPNNPDAMTLATVDADGFPNALAPGEERHDDTQRTN
jgi:pyridoxamine 5'-phosphate oxidase